MLIYDYIEYKWHEKEKKQHHLISFVINLCKIIQRKEAVHDETIKKDTLGYQIKSCPT